MAGGIRGLARAGSTREVCGLDREGLARRVLVAVLGSFRGRSGASPHGRYVRAAMEMWANVWDNQQSATSFWVEGGANVSIYSSIWGRGGWPPGGKHPEVPAFRVSGIRGFRGRRCLMRVVQRLVRQSWEASRGREWRSHRGCISGKAAGSGREGEASCIDVGQACSPFSQELLCCFYV